MFNFEKQSDEYKNEILKSPYEKRIFVEMLSSYGLHKYAKHTMCIDHFGDSADVKVLLKEYDYTSQRLANDIKKYIKESK